MLTVIPTDEQLDQIVNDALDSDGNLMRRFDLFVFPEKKPKMWGDWNRQVKLAWDKAVEFYFLERLERGLVKTPRKRQRGNKKITLREAWDAVLESLQHEDRYKRLTWGDLGERLGITTRATQYQIVNRLGFKLNGTVPDRGLVEAPCISCGTIHPMTKLTMQHCSVCLPNADQNTLFLKRYLRADKNSKGG